MTKIEDTMRAQDRMARINIALWFAQGVLALVYALSGVLKVYLPYEVLATYMPFVADTTPMVVQLIGIVEVCGSVGILLPMIVRILPGLTLLSALGLSVIQILAIGVHARYGETGQTLSVNLLLLFLSGFVLWGRWKILPSSDT